MSPILAVASNTFRQTVRDRIFFNVLFFGLGMTFLAIIVAQLSFGYPDRIVRSIGLSGVSLALDLIALLLGVGLIHQEIDRKTLFVVLTRPIRRWQYVFGRYLGLVGTLSLALIGFSVVFALALKWSGGTASASDVAALAMALPEASVIAGIGVVISCFSTPGVGTGMGLGIWLAAATTDDLVRLTTRSNELTRLVAKGVYYVLPSLERFDFRESAVYGQAIAMPDLLLTASYGAMYSLALALLASLVLSRRQMV